MAAAVKPQELKDMCSGIKRKAYTFYIVMPFRRWMPHLAAYIRE